MLSIIPCNFQGMRKMAIISKVNTYIFTIKNIIIIFKKNSPLIQRNDHTNWITSGFLAANRIKKISSIVFTRINILIIPYLRIVCKCFIDHLKKSPSYEGDLSMEFSCHQQYESLANRSIQRFFHEPGISSCRMLSGVLRPNIFLLVYPILARRSLCW